MSHTNLTRASQIQDHTEKGKEIPLSLADTCHSHSMRKNKMFPVHKTTAEHFGVTRRLTPADVCRQNLGPKSLRSRKKPNAPCAQTSRSAHENKVLPVHETTAVLTRLTHTLSPAGACRQNLGTHSLSSRQRPNTPCTQTNRSWSIRPKSVSSSLRQTHHSLTLPAALATSVSETTVRLPSDKLHTCLAAARSPRACPVLTSLHKRVHNVQREVHDKATLHSSQSSSPC